MNKMTPPKWIAYFLRWFCPDHLLEEIEGDLIQKFESDVKTFGERKARRRFVWNVVRFCRPGILLRNRFSFESNRGYMFRNYFKTSYRHIKKNKINFSFKLGGLMLAIFSLLIIIIYVSYQWSFDRFHQEYENIYRVNSNRDEDGKMASYSSVPPAIGPALKAEFPEVVTYARLGIANRVMIQYKDKLLRLPGFVEADSSIFDVLSFSFIEGNKNALHQPGSVVLSQSIAKQIFGDENPIGKVLASPDHSNKLLHVTAVIQDFPSNSHLNIQALHNFGSLLNTNMDSWEITWDGSVFLYVKLSPDSDADAFGSKAQPILKQNLVKSEDGSDRKFSIYLQSISTIYLGKVLKMEFSRKGNALYVYLFSILGVFLLAIACINYINLSIADFDTRTKEIGVRRALGARKIQIVFQIVFETLLIAIAALIIGVGFLHLFFPIVSETLDAALRFDMLLNWDVIVLTGLILVMIIIFSAAFPARQFVQSTISHKTNARYGHGMSMGKTLLFVQFVVSTICICATVIIGKQISFVKETDLGYDRSHVVSLVMPDEYPADRVALLKNAYVNLAGVESVSYSYYLMPISTYFKGWYEIERKGKMERVLLNEMFVDHDYFETMGIRMAVGRNFDVGNPADVKTAFIVNETAAKELGWIDPIGKRMKVGYNESSDENGTVIGVVKDFNSLSLHKKIEPVVLRLQYDTWPGNSLNVKIKGSLSETLPLIISTYEKLMPGYLADARVLEDLHKRQYQDEDKAFASLQIGTIVIIIISAIGIFSLSFYTSIKRLKEFGIRKVLGASVWQIASLQIGDFVKVVFVANIFALPVSYWLMNEWLDGFAYRTELSVFVFIGVMGISFLLVIISGSYSAWKAGRMNPIDVIKIQ